MPRKTVSLARNVVRTALSSLVLLPAAALADPWWKRYAPVPDVSKDGYRVEDLFWYTTNLCLFAFSLVVIALVGFCIVYRSRPGHLRGFYYHGTDKKSLFVTGSLAALVFLSVDMRLVRGSEKDIKEYFYNWPTSPDTFKVEVMPQQWAWNFRYAGADGLFNTADDVITLNDLRVPVGRPIFVQLKAKDVIHSFYLPNFRIKQDANPGHVTRVWFEAKQTGKFEIACSQMCGWAHYKMQSSFTVLAAADFDRWYKEAQGDAARKFDPADKDAFWGWTWEK